ncbi:glycosyltransferase family 9 protein [Flavobacterium selenitireducens]|uniref:glycosyltransferase family 9 protein n=1 Tax=Flavobacterium selenitireducens TaxID=2722704 RepID=UPI00168A4B58|nr:glycosyltransferase family 9 protein [Flavobacterium selenitireducens]MBD3582618.1 glycosyltransferase family 9 protein [Flavobacterium selenitireducens]
MKILVIQQKMIGDVLATSIICNNLKMLYPDSRVDYLVYPFTRPVVENNPNIDNLILFKDEFRKSKKALLKFLVAIRKTRYDIVIDAYGKLESNIVVGVSGAKKKIGFYKSYTQFVYDETVREKSRPETDAGLAIENRLLLLKSLSGGQKLDNRPRIFLSDKEIANGKNILESHNIDFSRKCYMIGVLGSGGNKTYPFPFMARILDEIVSQTNATLLFNYMPIQEAQAREIFNMCGPKTQENIKFHIVPGSIREFLSLTYHCDALIGNEGGAVNMAKALMKPTFTIFSTWIKKEAWNAFDDGLHNVSVHLKDFRPDLYGSKSAKQMKDRAMELYGQFSPDLILPELHAYLDAN